MLNWHKVRQDEKMKKKGITVVKDYDLAQPLWRKKPKTGYKDKTPAEQLEINKKKAETRRKNSSKVDVQRVVPTKKEIREYCRNNDRFRELDDYITEAQASYRAKEGKSYPGTSAAITERTRLRTKILKEKPYGDILPV